MKKPSVYSRILSRTKPESRRYVEKNMAISAYISDILEQKGWTQKDLAKAMGKTESEVSKWLSGLHNLTLKSIAKLEVVLDAEILEIPKRTESQIEIVSYKTIIVKPQQWLPSGAFTESDTPEYIMSHEKKESMVA